MSNTLDKVAQELSNIVCHVEDPNQLSRDQILVKIDKATGRAVDDKGLSGLASKVFKKRMNMAITPDLTQRIDGVASEFNVFLTKEDANVKMRMQLTARGRDAIRIAESFYSELEAPAQILQKTIRSALADLLEDDSQTGPESVAERFVRKKSDWQHYLQRVIDRELGLEASIIFEIPSVFINTDLSERIDSQRVTPADAPHTTFSLTTSLTLEREDSSASEPMPRRAEERDMLLRKIIDKVVRDNISTYDFWYRPQLVKDVLKAALNKTLAVYSYSVKQIHLEPESPSVPDVQTLTVDLPWKGRLGREVSFHVEARLRMNENGGGLYHSKKQPDRQKWLTAEMKNALSEAMFGKDALNLAVDDENKVRGDIHGYLNDQAAKIGHSVETFIADANIPEKVWLHPRIIDIPTATYHTKDDMVPAEFAMSLVVRMGSLSIIEQIVDDTSVLKSSANDLIQKEICRVTSEVATRVMSNVEPHEYYSEFEQWDITGMEQHAAGGSMNFIRDRLTEEISHELKSRFNLVQCDVTLRRVDSKSQEASKMIMGVGDLVVEDLLIRPTDVFGDDKAVKFQLIFEARAIDATRMADVLRFIESQKTRLTTESLTEEIRGLCWEVLSTLTQQELLNFGGIKRIRNGVETSQARTDLGYLIEKSMRDLRGITIVLKSVKRERSEQEELRDEVGSLETIERKAITAQHIQDIKEAAEMRQEDFQYLKNRQRVLRQLINDNPRNSPEDTQELQSHTKELKEVDEELALTVKHHQLLSAHKAHEMRQIASTPLKKDGPEEPQEATTAPKQESDDIDVEIEVEPQTKPRPGTLDL